MTDIVARLRDYSGGRGTKDSLLHEAADEIERLRRMYETAKALAIRLADQHDALLARIDALTALR